MRRFHRKHYRWLRHIPRRRHLKNGWLHKLVGDGLFAPDLWRPNRRSVAGGLALGLLIGFTPTMGVQIILCGVLAYFLRVNVPLALAGSLVTNPFTAAVVYPLEYQVGVWLIGVPGPSELAEYTGPVRSFARYAKPLWVGSLAVGSFAAVVAYVLVMLMWKEAENLRGALHRKHSPPVGGGDPSLPASAEAEPVTPSPAEPSEKVRKP